MQIRIDHALKVLLVLTILTMCYTAYLGLIGLIPTLILGANVYWISFYLNVFQRAMKNGNQNPPKVKFKKTKGAPKRDFRAKMKDAADKKDK